MKLIIESDEQLEEASLRVYLKEMNDIVDGHGIVRNARHFGADEGRLYDENGNVCATWRLEP